MDIASGASALDPSSRADFVSFIDRWNRAQGLVTPPLHVELGTWLSHAWRRQERRLLLQMFRGAGKSTLVGLFCAWLLASDPEHRILVISADHLLACRMTRNVRRVIETFEDTAPIRGRRGGEWAADRFTVPRRSVLRDPSLLARGINATITGSHADVVICDDVEVPATCGTAAKRTALRTALTEIGVVLVPGGRVLYVGTPHSHYSIYADRPRADAGETRPFLADYRRLTVPVVGPAGSAWPERFSPAEIERVRTEIGPMMFRSQMMLEPVDPEKVRLDPDQLVRYEGVLTVAPAKGASSWSIDGMPMRDAVCWWDPALGRDERADSTVVAVMFEDFDHGLWLHEVHYLRSRAWEEAAEAEADQLCGQVCDLLARIRPRAIHVESNGVGQGFAGILKRTAAGRSMRTAIVEAASHRNKAERIALAFDLAMSGRRLRVHGSVWRSPFIQEVRAWRMNGGCRDDGLDAVSGCIDLLPLKPMPAGGVPSRVRQAVVNL